MASSSDATTQLLLVGVTWPVFEVHSRGHEVCVGTMLPPLPRHPAALKAALPAQPTPLLAKQAGRKALCFYSWGFITTGNN